MGHKPAGQTLTLLILAVLSLSGCGEFVGFRSTDGPETGLESFRLYLSDDELGTLADSLSYGTYASCRFEPAEVPEGPTGGGRGELRIRGFTSRMLPKMSYTLRWEETGEEYKIALDAGGDPWLSYALAMYTYHLAGLPHLEMSPIALYLNDEYMGYYNSLPLYNESVDDFFGEKGHLYKIRGFDLGKNVPAEEFSEKKFPDDDDFGPLNRYLVNAAHMSESDWISWAEANVHLEDLARYMVVRDFLGMADTYETNFYVYAGAKYRILPWDNDHTYRYTPVGGDNALTRRMLESDAYARIYRDTFNALFLEPGEENLIGNMALYTDNLYDKLQTAVQAEPWFYLTAADFEAEKQHIEDFLSDRVDSILADPGWYDFFVNNGPVPDLTGD
ncbi:MAG: CotH kinase family protein [Spirochaetales bacterium]|nr:CotH kinase family protein [Spirochaetales bacterium]